jgi:4-amino-4-deoxychorismate lyase
VDTWLVNGQVADAVPVSDRGLAYGDGLFETIAWRGGQPRFFGLHMERLAEGCRRLGMPAPIEAQLLADMRAAAGHQQRGTARIMVTRGSGPRGYAPPPQPAPLRVVAFFPAGALVTEVALPAASVRMCRATVSVNPLLAGLKTLGRLDHVLARAEWSDPQIAEGLMRDPAGHVVCGTMSNLFAVRDGRLLTPELNRCGVRGVMRRVVMRAAQDLGIDVAEVFLSDDDIVKAEELFLTNALIGVRPVAHFEGRPYAIGPVTGALRRVLGANVEECRA